MPTPRDLREAGSKTQEQNSHRFDGIELTLVDSVFVLVIKYHFSPEAPHFPD